MILDHRGASERLPDGWTVSSVARAARIHRDTVARALLREGDPRVSTLRAISSAVGLAVIDLWPELSERPSAP